MSSSRHPARRTATDQPLPFGPDAEPDPAPVRPSVVPVADVPEPTPALPGPEVGSEGAATLLEGVEPGRSRSERGSRSGRSRLQGATPSSGLTSEQRILRARLAAYHLHATHDPKETTRKAREVFLSRFEREVDPDGVLTPGERARRAEAARRAYFTRLAFQSSRARRRAG